LIKSENVPEPVYFFIWSHLTIIIAAAQPSGGRPAIINSGPGDIIFVARHGFHENEI
jgi:hypothetical protein